MVKILIIEDEANIAQILRLYLEQANFTTLIASDGAAGLELHAREHPDLVILDLMLPALDGMEVCRRLKEDSRTAREGASLIIYDDEYSKVVSKANPELGKLRALGTNPDSDEESGRKPLVPIRPLPSPKAMPKPTAQ